MKMFIKRKYVHRHKILQALQICYNESYSPNVIDSSEYELSWSELMAATGLKDEEILAQIDFLLTSEEIFNNEVDFSSSYLILQKGTVAFYDKKYLNNGSKESRENLYDILKLVSGIVLLLIAITTFVKNILTTEKNSRDIEKLKQEIIILKHTN